MSQKGWPAFRVHCLSTHTHNIRAIVGPFLNEGVSRSTAAREIGAVISMAFDLSARIFTSEQTFVMTFPKCGSRFLHTSMICVDPTINESPLDIHVRQVVLKLVITPTITMRDDRKMSITVRSLQNSDVLIED